MMEKRNYLNGTVILVMTAWVAAFMITTSYYRVLAVDAFTTDVLLGNDTYLRVEYPTPPASLSDAEIFDSLNRLSKNNGFMAAYYTRHQEIFSAPKMEWKKINPFVWNSVFQTKDPIMVRLAVDIWELQK